MSFKRIHAERARRHHPAQIASGHRRGETGPDASKVDHDVLESMAGRLHQAGQEVIRNTLGLIWLEQAGQNGQAITPGHVLLQFVTADRRELRVVGEVEHVARRI